MNNVAKIKNNSQKIQIRIHVIRLKFFFKTYQDDFKARMLEEKEGVHSGDTLPRAFHFFLSD